MAHNDNAGSVRAHTPAHGARRLALALACGVVLACAPGAARAQDWHDTDARVIWTRAPFAYVVADSGVLAPGMPLAVWRGKRQVAAAFVERMLEPGLALARVHDGSLAGEKRLDKLRVRASAAPAARHGTLRVGLPAPTRPHLLFTCTAPHWNDAYGGYTADTLARGLVALRRVPGPAASSAEPETLLVRFFADAADQEIALERGELDAAVFWPGELSARMRADARWREPALARRREGVLACAGTAADSLAPDPEALAALQRDVFAGDLEPLPLAPRPGAAPARLARLEPDPSLPGAAVLARVLARTGPRGPALRLVCVPSASGALRPVFALRCPVLVAPALRGGWPAHEGAAELANLLQCAEAR